MNQHQKRIASLMERLHYATTRIETLASEGRLDFFEPSECARLRALIRILTRTIENVGPNGEGKVEPCS